MKIGFVESFCNKEWNGYTARYLQGVSGSHATIFYLAEAIARRNHDVSIIQTNAVFESKIVNGVYYHSMENLSSEKDHFDVLIFTFYLQDLKVLRKIKHSGKVAFIMNCIKLDSYEEYHYNSLFNLFPFNNINILYVSENCKINTFLKNRHMENIRHHLLYNSIDIRDFTNSNGELYTCPEDKKENNFVFFACVERGFNLVVEIAKQFNGKFNIVASNYNDANFSSEDNIRILHPENTSKQCILNWNRKSKYFIYPLINTNNNWLHYDTFAYVVLEALLCGVIVIAPRMSVYEELYGDAIYYIDTTDLVSQDNLTYSHWYEESTNMIWNKLLPNMGYPTIDRYVDAINRLENDAELRRTYIQRGFSLKDKFSNEKMADSFLNYIYYSS